MLKFLQGIEDLSDNIQIFLAMMVLIGFFATIPLTYGVVYSFLPTCEEAAQEKIEPMRPTKPQENN